MYILFFVLWIIFNGKITVEITVFGVLIAAAMYAFLCKFMDFSPQKELFVLRKAGYLCQYFYFLVIEIVKANVATIRLMLSGNFAEEPAVIIFKTNLKTDMAKCLLANSITLTPGTITVEITGQSFKVHCLDKSFAEGIDQSIFVQLLEKMEA